MLHGPADDAAVLTREGEGFLSHDAFELQPKLPDPTEVKKRTERAQRAAGGTPDRADRSGSATDVGGSPDGQGHVESEQQSLDMRPRRRSGARGCCFAMSWPLAWRRLKRR